MVEVLEKIVYDSNITNVLEQTSRYDELIIILEKYTKDLIYCYKI